MSQDQMSQALLLRLDQKVSPAHTALVIVDMQNDFCSQGGFLDQHTALSTAGPDSIIDNVQALRMGARESGALTIHVKSHFGEESLNGPMRERLIRKGFDPYCVPGSWGAEIVEQLKPEDDEIEVVKHTYDGFFETALHDVLTERQIRTIVVTGVATDNCVAATAKSGFYRGYYVVIPTDACATGSESQQEAALTMASHAYAHLCRSDEVLDVWKE